ncbi:MAG: hypothetical protein FGM27_02600 [Candidatus Omnitrophica bacterium]|nr:hypothetical protein [Candidatus Omnitrophota bacterium]
MIEINLLPEDLRIEEKEPAPEVPIVKILAGAVVFFVLLTCFFYWEYLNARAVLRKTETHWQSLSAQSGALTKLQNDVEKNLRQEKDFFSKFVASDMSLTRQLVWIADSLPESAWLTTVRMENNLKNRSLVVRGLCLPSKKSSSIILIEAYLNSLKSKMIGAKLSLTTSRQVVASAEVTEFTAIFSWPVPETEKKAEKKTNKKAQDNGKKK